MKIEPTPLERFLAGILPENPVYRQLLGMCPVLAVTAALKPALTMVAATAFVLVSANLVTSLIRRLLQPHLRILVFTLTIATFVTIADRLLAAFAYPMSQQLGPYVPLIIVNCMIICRCEVCASKQGPATALADAAGNSLGFLLAMASVATVREALGMGTLLGFQVLPESVPRLVLMVMPPGAFLSLGVLLAATTAIEQRRKRRRAAAGPAEPSTVLQEAR